MSWFSATHKSKIILNHEFLKKINFLNINIKSNDATLNKWWSINQPYGHIPFNSLFIKLIISFFTFSFCVGQFTTVATYQQKIKLKHLYKKTIVKSLSSLFSFYLRWTPDFFSYIQELEFNSLFYTVI